jgi:hypothetical protein
MTIEFSKITPVTFEDLKPYQLYSDSDGNVCVLAENAYGTEEKVLVYFYDNGIVSAIVGPEFPNEVTEDAYVPYSGQVLIYNGVIE